MPVVALHEGELLAKGAWQKNSYVFPGGRFICARKIRVGFSPIVIDGDEGGLVLLFFVSVNRLASSREARVSRK